MLALHEGQTCPISFIKSAKLISKPDKRANFSLIFYMNAAAKILTKYWKNHPANYHQLGFMPGNTLPKIYIYIFYEYRYKNTQQNTSKSNQVTFKGLCMYINSQWALSQDCSVCLTLKK